MSNTARSISPSETIEIETGLASRDRLHLKLLVSPDGEILESRLFGIACPELLKLMARWRPLLTGKLADLALPEGTGHASILLRELILKAQGRWKFPYKETELCHCRAVSTQKVDNAIVGGCHTVAAVMRATSAGTSCGSCRPDSESIINYRLYNKGVS